MSYPKGAYEFPERRTGGTVKCPCGVEFYAAGWEIKAGRRKYCSKACGYRYRQHPNGVGRPVQKGQRLSPSTEFKIGERKHQSTEFKPGQIPHNFKGDAVGYASLHDWVRRHRGRPVLCEHCGSVERLQWANKTGKYRRRFDDWLSLCYSCHRKYDKKNGWGKMKTQFVKTPSGNLGGIRKVSV